MLRYICSLPNPGTSGIPHEVFYADDEAGRERAEKFAQLQNKPGRGVYDCIGTLRADAKSRSKDTVAELDRLIVDLDLKNIVESRDEVLQQIKSLLLPPSEIRDSGFGLHGVWHLKEPLNDDAGLTQAEDVMRRLAKLLAGDPAPTHRAALLRRPGTNNTKGDEPRQCYVIERSDATYDITEFDALFDLYGDRPLLNKQGQKGNGPDSRPETGERGPVDVEGEIASMCDGATTNAAQCRIIPALLWKAMHPNEVRDYVVDATMAMAERHGLNWTREKEICTVRQRIVSAYNNLLLKDCDHTGGVIPAWLPGEFHKAWIARLEAGQRPVFSFNRGGFYIRKKQGNGKKETGAETDTDDNADDNADDKPEPPPRAPGSKQVLELRPFVPFDAALLPPRAWLYCKHYQRRTVSLTAGPGGMGKSSLDLVEAIAMATCRNLLGEQPEVRLRVWYHNGEDPLDEINRRIAAICQYYKIPQEELPGQLWVTSGNEFPLRVAKGYTNLAIDTVLVRQISAAISNNQIDLAIFDPLVTLHSVSEVDSGKMDAVVRVFAGIGDENDAGIELAHHMRKPAAGTNGDYDVHDIRGVAAITDAVRAARVLNRMNERDAESAGCTETERLSRFRVDRAKGNYSPAQAATWRQFLSVELANGDDVGVVAPWHFPGQGENTPEKAAADQKAEHVFLQLLDKFLARNMNVSANSGHNYAPAKFAEEQEARIAKISKAALKAAMRRLLDAGRIRTEPIGRGDRPSQHRLVPWQGTPK
jgi:RecA-family ATPase